MGLPANLDFAKVLILPILTIGMQLLHIISE